MVRTFVAVFATLLIFSCSVGKPSARSGRMKHMVRLEKDGNVYYAKYEVTNESYHDFLNAMALVDSSDWEKCRYDSTGWVSGAGEEALALQKSYHSHPAFAHYPVVNITPYAAARYCEWLNRKFENSNLVYRLPTLVEQQRLLARMDTTEFTTLKRNRSRETAFANLAYQLDGYSDNGDDGATYATSVYNYQQNKQGATSLIGNVSEMNSEGSRLGGGWNESSGTVMLPTMVDGTDPGTGFRVFVEVVE